VTAHDPKELTWTNGGAEREVEIDVACIFVKTALRRMTAETREPGRHVKARGRLEGPLDSIQIVEESLGWALTVQENAVSFGCTLTMPGQT